jgi:hypothetical protein
VMVHAQKPDIVFRRNGRVHLNRRGRQFCRLLAAVVCASAVVMLDTPCSEVVCEYWLPTPFASFPFTSPPVRHRVPLGFNWTLQAAVLNSEEGPCSVEGVRAYCYGHTRTSASRPLVQLPSFTSLPPPRH